MYFLPTWCFSVHLPQATGMTWLPTYVAPWGTFLTL